jgi:hypothetical protein
MSEPDSDDDAEFSAMKTVYPMHVALAVIYKALSTRSDGAIRKKITELKKEKKVFGEAKTGYRLTTAGHSAAVIEIKKHVP